MTILQKRPVSTKAEKLHLLPLNLENQTVKISHLETVKIILRHRLRLQQKPQQQKVLMQRKLPTRPAKQNNETEAEESTAAVIEKLEESKTEKETSNASEGGPGTVKPKETEKAQETTADNSSKGPGVQETSDSSNSKPDEMPGNAEPIGPGV